MLIVPVILSGGAGSRLWPVSREAHPKPFMQMPDGESLLEKTLKRVLAIKEIEKVLTLTNRAYYFQTVDEYKKVEYKKSKSNQTENTQASSESTVTLDYLLEPVGRNTAPAIIAAALSLVDCELENAIMLVLPADHLITPVSRFVTIVEQAALLAGTGKLVTFGVKPTVAETGYGYLKKGKALSVDYSFEVDAFIEKPDISKATEFLKSGEYLWNAGMFCFTAKNLLQEFEKHNSALLSEVKKSWLNRSTTQPTELAEKIFEKIKAESIDYALMEKSSNVALIECDFEWNDVGSWDSISKQHEVDEQGNTITAKSILFDCKNNYIRHSNRLIAGIGLNDLIIVDTPDALLVATKDKAQDVKKVVEYLKQIDHAAYQYHSTVHRPWGTYTVLEEGERFKLKRIVVKPGAILSLQKHHHRSEHWIVVSGTAETIIDGERKIVHVNESTFVPVGIKHRLLNPGLVDLVMIEVQSGEYLGEDDIIRFDDEYGRD